MKLTVFGATGKVGRNVIDQALEQGHEVIAFARSPEKLSKHDQNLQVMKGDVLDPASVERAVDGSDVVICALGMPLMNKDGLRAKGTRNIIDAMERTGVRRLVCLSGLGAGDSWNTLPVHYKYLIFPLLMRRVFADHERQENHVTGSPLDWVLVRPGNFVKGPHTGSYRHGFTADDEPSKLRISHADVADFMVRQVTDDTYLHRAASLSY